MRRDELKSLIEQGLATNAPFRLVRVRDRPVRTIRTTH
jgi:hypothetical protein